MNKFRTGQPVTPQEASMALRHRKIWNYGKGREQANAPLNVRRAVTLLSSLWKVLFPLASILILGLAMAENTSSVPFLFCICFVIGILVIRLMVRGAEMRRALRLFAAIYALNVIMVVLFFYSFHYYYGNPYLSGGTDDMNFDYCARSAAESLKSTGKIVIPAIISRGVSTMRYEKYRPYITILAAVYYISDAIAADMHTINVRLLNSLAIAFIALLTYLLAIRCKFHQTFSFLAAFIVGVYPSQVFWGTVIVRDTLVVLFSVGAVYSIHGVITTKGPATCAWIIASALFVYAAYLMRMESGILIAIAIVAATCLLAIKNRSLPIKILFTSVYVVFSVFLISYSLTFIDTFYAMYETYTQHRMQFAQGLSLYVFSVPLIPLGAVLRPLYALISPFPSLSLNFQYIYQSLGTIAVIMMLPFVFVGLFTGFNDRRKCVLSVVFVCLLIGTSWTTSHLRHLLVYMPFLFLLFVYGWSVLKHPRRLLLGGVLVNMALAMLYFELKLLGT